MWGSSGKGSGSSGSGSGSQSAGKFELEKAQGTGRGLTSNSPQEMEAEVWPLLLCFRKLGANYVSSPAQNMLLHCTQIQPVISSLALPNNHSSLSIPQKFTHFQKIRPVNANPLCSH